MSTLKLTKNIYAVVRNYKDGRQTIKFKDSRHPCEFVVIHDLESRILVNEYSIRKLYEEISLQWKELRWEHQFNELLNFVNKCGSKTVLEFTLLKTNVDYRWTERQKEIIRAIIKQKVEL